MAIQRIVKMTFQLDKCDDFQNFFTEIKDQIQNQPGCHEVRLLKDKAASGVFFTYSVWDDQKSLDAYRHTDLFAKVWPTVKEWFAAKPEAWSTELISKA
ncbi:MAG: antibiotic biosynthesis monooxygenase [Crocinitomicaceae bacterium]|nr:antibiotic biosynthesis monooxygenase [Crocinitomicaceae bacterium]